MLPTLRPSTRMLISARVRPVARAAAVRAASAISFAAVFLNPGYEARAGNMYVFVALRKRSWWHWRRMRYGDGEGWIWEGELSVVLTKHSAANLQFVGLEHRVDDGRGGDGGALGCLMRHGEQEFDRLVRTLKRMYED